MSCNESPYKKAINLYRQGEYVAALREIKNDTTIHSRFLKYRIYIVTDKYYLIEDTLKTLLLSSDLPGEYKDTVVELYDLMCQKLWDDGIENRAISYWSYLLKYYPSYNIGRGFYPLAMESLRVIKETFPSYEAVLSVKEKIRVNRCLSYLMNALSLEKDKIKKINLYNGIVDLFLRLHDYDRVKVWINRGKTDIGDNSGLRVKKGIMLFQLIQDNLERGKKVKALEYTSLFIANGSPQDLLDDVYYIRGELLYKNGEIEGAKAAFQKVIKMHLYDSDPLKLKAKERLKEINNRRWAE